MPTVFHKYGLFGHAVVGMVPSQPPQRGRSSHFAKKATGQRIGYPSHEKVISREGLTHPSGSPRPVRSELAYMISGLRVDWTFHGRLIENGFVFNGGIDMRSSCLVAVSLYLMGATIALAQTPQRTEGPGLKAQEDSRYKAEIALCKNHHPVIRNAGAAGGRAPPAAPPAYEGPAQVQAIPGVIAAGAHWRSVWHESGNNADGIVATSAGVLVAQQDSSDVVRVDAAGHAKVVYKDTNTGGAVSINKQGQTFVVERGLHQAIWEVSPDHKMLADTIDGDSLDCLGSGGLNDLTAAANGGVYFTLGDLYYVAPSGTITRQGDVTGTNGIILSPDEKRMYVTSGGFGRPGNLMVFDVQPDGSLTNQRVFAHLTGGGDGSTVDSEGRIYVSSGTVIDVISPDDGHLLGRHPPSQGRRCDQPDLRRSWQADVVCSRSQSQIRQGRPRAAERPPDGWPGRRAGRDPDACARLRGPREVAAAMRRPTPAPLERTPQKDQNTLAEISVGSSCGP